MSVQPIKETLTGTTNPRQIGPGSISNECLFSIPSDLQNLILSIKDAPLKGVLFFWEYSQGIINHVVRSILLDYSKYLK